MVSGGDAILRSFATSFGASTTSGGTPSHAFDGNSDSYWYAARNLPEYIGWRFPQAVSINEVSWICNGNKAVVFAMSIQSSRDGETWVDEWSEAGFSGTGTKTSTRP
ncbi:hypothetical protein MACH17_19160 [Phaeobacter inhibens]|uniref:discoidin domain-containing protein n=1 Tax=Phaeobacter inhibens TaxID=221822 RepID=UPI0027508CB7|nr:hypothetical protein MACH17_19160 [Phaeobacter inhibens]